MSQQAKIAAALARLTTAINTVAGRVGTLGNLTTTEKSSLVGALNEVKASIGSAGVQIDDANAASGTTWSSTKIQTQINAAITALINGAGVNSDSLKELADQIAALAQADNGLLSLKAAQSFTVAEQQQGGANLGMGDPHHDFVPDIEAALASGL